MKTKNTKPNQKKQSSNSVIPEKLSFLEFAKKIQQDPSFLKEELPRDRIQRGALLSQIKHEWFHVTPRAYEVYECYHEVMTAREHYLNSDTFHGILNNIIEWHENAKDPNYRPRVYFNRTIDGFTIIGPSGLGKTLTVNTILRDFFPQVVKHKNYLQAVHIKVNCTTIGSTKSLCYQILHEFDRVLGTNYFKRYSTSSFSAEKLLPVLSDIFHIHSCLVFTLDECNHLADMKGQSKAQIIGFLKNLGQVLGLPIVYVGTPEAIPILAGNLQIARRSQGIQSIMWDRYLQETKEEKAEWERLLRSLWKNQVLLKPGELTATLKKTYYDLSQGVLDVLIKLHVLAQKRALSKGFEAIDEALLRAVSKDLALTNPMINAIRSKNSYLISQYRDISMDNLRIVKETNNKSSLVDGPDELTRLFDREFSSEEIKFCMQQLLKKNPNLKPEDLMMETKTTLGEVKTKSPEKVKTGRKPTGRLVDEGKKTKSKNKYDAIAESEFVTPLTELVPKK